MSALSGSCSVSHCVCTVTVKGILFYILLQRATWYEYAAKDIWHAGL